VHYQGVSSSTDTRLEGDRRVFRRISQHLGDGIDMSSWPATVPAVAQMLRSGLDLGAGVTVLTGENGSGKSTVVEVIAEACGLNPQGGSAKARYQTRDSEPGIGQFLWAERGPGHPSWSYFLRADTVHGLYSYFEQNPGKRPERFHELSHGEGFLEILRTRVNQAGFYLMDEPDAPLSFVSCLGFVALLHDLAEAGGQIVVANTRRSWPRCPVPGSWNWVTGGSARRAGENWSWSPSGVSSCASPRPSSGISSTISPWRGD